MLLTGNDLTAVCIPPSGHGDDLLPRGVWAHCSPSRSFKFLYLCWRVSCKLTAVTALWSCGNPGTAGNGATVETECWFTVVFFVPRLHLLMHSTSLSPGNVFHEITVGSQWTLKPTQPQLMVAPYWLRLPRGNDHFQGGIFELWTPIFLNDFITIGFSAHWVTAVIHITVKLLPDFSLRLLKHDLKHEISHNCLHNKGSVIF